MRALATVLFAALTILCAGCTFQAAPAGMSGGNIDANMDVNRGSNADANMDDLNRKYGIPSDYTGAIFWYRPDCRPCELAKSRVLQYNCRWRWSTTRNNHFWERLAPDGMWVPQIWYYQRGIRTGVVNPAGMEPRDILMQHPRMRLTDPNSPMGCNQRNPGVRVVNSTEYGTYRDANCNPTRARYVSAPTTAVTYGTPATYAVRYQYVPVKTYPVRTYRAAAPAWRSYYAYPVQRATYTQPVQTYNTCGGTHAFAGGG